MLRHMSQFNLREMADDAERDALLETMWRRVSQLPQAREVRLYRQISPGNPFDYCIEVTLFGDEQEQLEKYLNNPAHERFCKEIWDKYVVNQLDLNILSLF